MGRANQSDSSAVHQNIDVAVLVPDSFECGGDILIGGNVYLDGGRSPGAQFSHQLVCPNNVLVEYDQRPTGVHHFGGYTSSDAVSGTTSDNHYLLVEAAQT